MQCYNHSICWFRRDLRLDDHAALYHALKNSRAVHCVFVFDSGILDALSDKQDRRVEFIWHSLYELNVALQQQGSTLQILHGNPVELIPRLARELEVQAVFCNRDYEPLAAQRDAAVAASLSDIDFHQYKDQVIFEQSELLTGGGTPYSVFTPYKNAWLKKLDDFYLRAYPAERYFSSLAKLAPQALPALASLGFLPGKLNVQALPAGASGAAALFEDFVSRIDAYAEARNFPAVKGVSYLSVHLRFGTISIRRVASSAYYSGGAGGQVWLSELIWRDFYQMQLHHHPQLAQGDAFKAQFNDIRFPNEEGKFAAWCEARTGYPLIDAAMRQLNGSGYMHNRLRMVTASFLVKDLHVDWRWGERYFAQHLIDFDLAANNGGWQWAASTGCDAQPWFRIFNPVTQSEKFDAAGRFIRRYVPELAGCPDKWIHAPWLMPVAEQQRCGVLAGKTYPLPVVDHAVARITTLALFKVAAG
ncbi:MAG TPA: deoxyribodipyrimidine photolyase [Gallionella sp.]|jgi:deoxyribodipyrimidine photo-lyase|nr:MAG: deoxyribodipyrimidine photolyase [Gallionellales bacterium GWA2_54_124]OGT17565.1 MAG: deoxyribodipyrimidine photolyase [Gallionellales bacterium RIFOXYD12_FULL_53_10]HCI54188.1 deoxyribodipyrimidine photolyase [Gallionella sp.]